MGKSRKTDREFTREQRLQNENRVLKRQVSSLRKELARIDLDRYANLKETIEQHYKEDEAQEGQNLIEKLKEEWKCHNCEDGYLEIFLYNKLNNTWYYRICSNNPTCRNRTKSQKYDPKEVKGIIKK